MSLVQAVKSAQMGVWPAPQLWPSFLKELMKANTALCILTAASTFSRDSHGLGGMGGRLPHFSDKEAEVKET